MNNFVLLNIGSADLHADWNWKDVYSPFARLYYVKSGRARTYIRDREYELEAGHLYLTPPFSLHQDECDDYFSLYYIHFYEDVTNRESIFDKYDFPVKLPASALDLPLIERLQSIHPDRYLVNIDPKMYDNPLTLSQNVAYNEKLPHHTLIETQSILSLLMSHFLEFRVKKSFDKDIRVNRSLQYIHEHIGQDISVQELAAIVCVSKDHFIRLFKKEMLLTPIKYIHSKKIEKAQLLLLTGDSPIRDIALDLSFDNISYFNKIFKQYTGKTPSEYRKNVQLSY
jgi:AraC-like DNA-binding protein